MSLEFDAIIERLARADVKFIVIGGVAAALHGAARATYDLDLVYERSSENIARLVNALADTQPYLRGAPPGLPFKFDAETLRRGLNFTFVTQLADLDLLGEIVGGGGYSQLLPFAVERTIGSLKYLCLDLPKLVEVKRAAGRTKDFEALGELQRLLKLRESK